MSWWLRHIGWWPPLFGTGIKVTRLDKDLRAIDVEMPLRPWNRNYVGVQFGGSLFALTDPFYMIMLATNLGPEYVVWDKAASIRYKKPGLGRVRAEFRLTAEKLAEIRAVLDREARTDARFVVEVKDDGGGVVAEVERVIYCATKNAHEERKNCGVVAGEVLLVFLKGVVGKNGFGCGVLVVSLWWTDGASVVFRRVFLGAEKYAIFSGFFLGLTDAGGVCPCEGSVCALCANAPPLKVERLGICSRARRSGSALAYFVVCAFEGAG